MRRRREVGAQAGARLRPTQARSGAREVPDAFTVMTVDPGVRTGVARGTFMTLPTLGETLRNGLDIEAWEVEGPPELQAWEIASEVGDWVFNSNVVCGLAFKDISLVMEAFTLRQMAVDLAPVEVRSAIKTLLVPRDEALGLGGWSGGYAGGIDVRDQEPGDAKGFATSERLKAWGLYGYGRSPGGRDHKRDALRHLALRVARIIGERA